MEGGKRDYDPGHPKAGGNLKKIIFPIVRLLTQAAWI